ncbi:MAG: DEAD/DEAH box helicase [Prevotella sp.]|nr:DEAD/DEAH box helicase [Prevotella sp.]
MKFEELDLSDNILDALYDMKFEECTPIQERTIPHILNGEDVLGIAQTGTGKTAAYLLPVLSLIDDYPADFPSDAINCVIMSPTRELAQQIDQAMQGFGYYLDGISSIPVYGGNDGNRFDQEVKAMREGAGLVIATPGRLISHLQIGNLDLSRCSFFILDEADRMLDMGFSEDIMKIAKELPPACQTIMFSATMPEKIEELAKTILKNPAEVKIAVSKPAEKIQQSAYVCYEPQKLRIIENIFRQGGLRRVIIFSGKKTKVKDITAKLTRMKINCGAMHSDLTQAERDEIMFRFKSGQTDVLVATDIVSRGIDIDDILMVINYDVPHDAEDYVHRIGRTARAQRDGRAVTLVSEDDICYFKAIEKFLEREVTKNPMPDGLDQGPDYKLPGKGGARPRQGTRRNAGTPRNARAPRAAKGGKPRQSKDAGAGKKPDRQRRKPKEEGAKTAE